MKKLLTLFCFIPFFFFSQEGPDSTFIIRQYGFADYGDYEKIRDSIGKIWNIRYRMVAGCVVTEEFEDSIRVLNNRTKKNLVLKHGEDWEKRFFSEVDAANDKLEFENENKLNFLKTVENDSCKIEMQYNFNQTKMVINYTELRSNRKKNETCFKLINQNDIKNNVLYLGLDNQFKIIFPKDKKEQEFQFNCEECEVYSEYKTDTNSIFTFNIKPKTHSKKAFLHIKNSEIDTTFEFNCKYTNRPKLSINNFVDGDTIQFKDLDIDYTVKLKFEDDFTYRVNFEVLSWEVSSVYTSNLKGRGNVIDKNTLVQLKNLKSKTPISIMCSVKYHDGVVRKIVGQFIIQ
ncbi:MAG: hypothetical protein ACK46Y_01860 [Fluviicola sp.]